VSSIDLGPGRLLDGVEIVVRVEPSSPPAELWAAAALASMCARVFGHVVTPSVPLPRPNPWGARTLAAVTGVSRFGRRGRSAATRRITIGSVPHAPPADIYVGGDDWTARVSRVGPVPVGPCRMGGLGLQAAAALAVGELIKELAPHVPTVRIEDELTWSLLDGRVTTPSSPPGLPPAPGGETPGRGRVRATRPTPPIVALLGAGSVGSSAAALLALSGVPGSVDVVDPDSFDPRRNAYRCPGVPVTERGPKADWAARVLAGAGWEARPHRTTVAGWARAHDRPGYPGFRGMALVSVDNVDGRREAAELMAWSTVSAGVDGMALHAQRHLPVDDLACPYCDLVDTGRWRTRGRLYARFGLTAPRLQALLDGDTLSADDVATAIWTGSVDPESMGRLVGGRLVDLLRQPPTGVTAASVAFEETTVSAPHVSWLAGTLLAAEVTKAAAGLPGIERRVDVDLHGVPLGGWRRPPRNPSGRCPCTNPARRDLARALYGP
jgi:hypothetical protein